VPGNHEAARCGDGTEDAWQQDSTQECLDSPTDDRGGAMPDNVRRNDPPPREPRGDVHVHNQPTPRGDGGGAGIVIGAVVVILLIAMLWFMFGRGDRTLVPNRIDIDVNLPEAPATPQPAQPAEPAPPPAQPAQPPAQPPAPDAGAEPGG
jgi:hypothetical protein